MKRGRPRHDDVLTPREWQVLELIQEGLTNEQIADRLDISLATAKFHVSEILGKLGLESRREVAMWQGQPRVALGFGPVSLLLHRLASVPPLKAVAVGAIATGVAALALLALGVILSKGGEDSLGKIAFVREGDIWVQALPDGVPVRVTNVGDATMPRWSPSGEWISFLLTSPPDGSKTHVIREDGTDEQRLNGIAQWSPVVDLLGYVATGSSDDGLSAVIVERPDGSDRRELVPPGDMRTGFRLRPLLGSSSYWSPDGSWLTYVELSRDDDPGGDDDGAQSELQYSVHRVDVSSGTTQELHAVPAGVQVQPGGWTKDNRKLLLLTRLAPSNTDALAEGPLLLYTEGSQNGGPTDTSLTLFHLAPTVVSAAPDGMSFALMDGPGPGWLDKTIVRYEPASGETSRLTDSSLSAIGAAWSQDGTEIAFVAGPSAPEGLSPLTAEPYIASRRLWLMDSNGENKRQMTNDPRYRDENPEWLADGRHILFARVDLEAEMAATSLWLLDTRTSRLEQVVGGLNLWEGYGFHWLKEQQLDYWSAP